MIYESSRDRCCVTQYNALDEKFDLHLWNPCSKCSGNLNANYDIRPRIMNEILNFHFGINCRLLTQGFHYPWAKVGDPGIGPRLVGSSAAAPEGDYPSLHPAFRVPGNISFYTQYIHLWTSWELMLFYFNISTNVITRLCSAWEKTHWCNAWEKAHFVEKNTLPQAHQWAAGVPCTSILHAFLISSAY